MKDLHWQIEYKLNNEDVLHTKLAKKIEVISELISNLGDKITYLSKLEVVDLSKGRESPL